MWCSVLAVAFVASCSHLQSRFFLLLIYQCFAVPHLLLPFAVPLPRFAVTFAVAVAFGFFQRLFALSDISKQDVIEIAT